MPVIIGVKREFEFTGNDLNGDPCIFPRATNNHVFVQAFNFRTKQIASDPKSYLAFPFGQKLSSSIVGLYSDGDSHASSDSQIMYRSDDDGFSWRTSVFYKSSSGAYDFSLLSDILAPGNSILLKSWNIKNISGSFSTVVVPTAVYGLTYALWSRAYPSGSGSLYRTGYAVNGSDQQVALFESNDGGDTWIGKSLMFVGAGRQYNECDIVNTTGQNWLAVCRENTGQGNPLYYSTSNDNGVNWSAPTAFPTASINGRQPNLTKLSDGSIILASGDRSGVSGYGGSGEAVYGFDTTGITIWRSTDNGTSWSFRTRLSPIYSTDGGQPQIVETTPGRICCVYYASKRQGSNPVIASATIDVANL